MTDLTNHDGFVTKAGALSEHNDRQPEKGDFEIGVEDGEGYVELPIFEDGETQRFPTTVEAVEQYLDRREEHHPHPQLPDAVDREPDVEAPEEWDEGQAVNTGGGIFCRIWLKQTEHGIIEVIHGLPREDGIGINLYTNDKEWVGEIDTKYVGEMKQDEELQEHAKDLMERFNSGEFDRKVEELAEKHKTS